MPLRIKSIKSPRGPDDGLRICIKGHLTLPDGITPDPEMVGSFDAWCPQIASVPLAKKWLKVLVDYARFGNATLLCGEEGPEDCHRRLVVEACKEINPSLKVIIE